MRFGFKILICIVGLFFLNMHCTHAQKARQRKMPLAADTTLHKINARPIGRKIIKPKPLRKEFALGIVVNNNGNGIGFRKYELEEDGNINRGFYINAAQIKSNKEIKIVGIRNSQDPNISTNTFTYGKINSLVNLQIGYSVRKKITGFLENTNVVIHGFGDVGLSLGLLKPYYLKLARSNSSGFAGVDEKYSDSNAVYFLDKSYIYSKSLFSVGLNESKLQVGANVKAGLQFEYLPTPFAGALIEIGFVLDAFTKGQKILVTDKPKQVYPGAFASIKYCIKSE